MRPSVFAALLLSLTLVSLCAGQAGVPTSAELEAVRQDFSQALKDWDRTDSNLTRDLLRTPPAEILPRISSTAGAREGLLELKSRYAQTAQRYYANQIGVGESKRGWTMLIDFRTLASNAQSDLATAIHEADIELRRVTLSERSLRASLREWKDKLESAYDEAAGLSQKAASAEAQLPALVSPALAVAAGMERISAHWAADAAQQARLSAGRYAEYRAMFQREDTLIRVRNTSAPETSLQAVVPTLAGTWFYSNPDARKTSDGSYETVMARAIIEQSGDKVNGTYECSFAVPPSEKFNPNVRFTFSGRITSEIMRFDVGTPLQGWVRIEKLGASKMRVTFHIDNAASQGISFGDVSDDSPQILDRRIQ